MGPRNLLLCLLALLALAPSSAAASGWPGFGGGAGRSGHDALDPGAGTPVAGVWERNSGPLPGETVRGGPVVAWGAPGGSRVAYGIESGSVFVQRFGDGSFIGSPSGVPVGSDADIFGAANGAVSPVTVSGALDPGQIYVLHNDDDRAGRTTWRSPRSTPPRARWCRTWPCRAPTASPSRALR